MKKLPLNMMLFALVSFCSCDHFGSKIITGNNIKKTKEFTVSNFTVIKLRSLVTVHVTQGALKPIKIVGDENILPYIEIYQDGDELTIKNKNWIGLESTHQIIAYVTLPNLKKIDVTGVGDFVTDIKITSKEEFEIYSGFNSPASIEMNIDAPKIAVNVSGIGNLTLKGNTKMFNLKIDGGNAYCYDLLADSTKVINSGIGEANVYAINDLQARATNLGRINYRGNPKTIFKNFDNNEN